MFGFDLESSNVQINLTIYHSVFENCGNLLFVKKVLKDQCNNLLTMASWK